MWDGEFINLDLGRIPVPTDSSIPNERLIG